MAKYIDKDQSNDGVDRRGFLQCMAWAGTGVLWALKGGVLKSYAMDPANLSGLGKAAAGAELSFVQISDSHIGFDKPANPDVSKTLLEAVSRINASAAKPAFILHTGDISHLSKPSEFDTAEQILKGTSAERVFYVPGEHDFIGDNGAQYLERYGKGTSGKGWYSFDRGGAHFVGLVNVADLKPGGMGNLGHDQLEWLEKDVKHLSASTPIVVFAHIPLWAVYPEWGWGTDDSAQALSYLKRFGSVSVLNGHIHQIMQKVEGNVTFHTAMSTAFPQPAPGTAPSPGPMKVPDDKLRSVLGITEVNFARGSHMLAVMDSNLAGGAAMAMDSMAGMSMEKKPASMAAPAAGKNEVVIDNFSFAPDDITVAPGTKLTWTNKDDVPHNVVSTTGKFKSPTLDTDQQFSFTFADPGTYDYYCAIHPRMTAKVIVKA
ncbi:MAG TPA: metallophosphoesterase [Candidatus Acidoferrales bacterium]|nr:metallophosphoesterase [Candidatus Acidoferrales bacterium]